MIYSEQNYLRMRTNKISLKFYIRFLRTISYLKIIILRVILKIALF